MCQPYIESATALSDNMRYIFLEGMRKERMQSFSH